LTQRRTLAPFGMEGADPGAKGNNIRVRVEGQREVLPGATSYSADAGEALIIETPGAGATPPSSQDYSQTYISLLTQRRSPAPLGLEGHYPGDSGYVRKAPRGRPVAWLFR
jgi:N-methylhydantoinase B/oxoprolinase/acetone carboxylase alpha subunit